MCMWTPDFNLGYCISGAVYLSWLFIFKIYLFYVHEHFVYICTCVKYILSAHGDQKRVFESLKLYLQKVVSSQVGASIPGGSIDYCEPLSIVSSSWLLILFICFLWHSVLHWSGTHWQGYTGWPISTMAASVSPSLGLGLQVSGSSFAGSWAWTQVLIFRQQALYFAQLRYQIFLVPIWKWKSF